MFGGRKKGVNGWKTKKPDQALWITDEKPVVNVVIIDTEQDVEM